MSTLITRIVLFIVSGTWFSWQMFNFRWCKFRYVWFVLDRKYTWSNERKNRRQSFNSKKHYQNELKRLTQDASKIHEYHDCKLEDVKRNYRNPWVTGIEK